MPLDEIPYLSRRDFPNCCLAEDRLLSIRLIGRCCLLKSIRGIEKFLASGTKRAVFLILPWFAVPGQIMSGPVSVTLIGSD